MEERQTEIIEKLITVAQTLPDSTISQLCAELDKLPADAHQDSMLSACSAIGNPGHRMNMQGLIRAWSAQEQSATPGNLAWALRGAAGVDNHWRNKQSLELVWTGPSSEDSTLRRTDQALLDVIQVAQSELIIVTFVAYKVQSIADALRKAIERGVQIYFILESEDVSTAKSALETFGALAEGSQGKLTLYEWPISERECNEHGKHGALHAKCAVADGEVAFISSANLTGHAMNLNMELGILIRGGEIPPQVKRHLYKLITERSLKRLLNKAIEFDS